MTKIEAVATAICRAGANDDSGCAYADGCPSGCGRLIGERDHTGDVLLAAARAAIEAHVKWLAAELEEKSDA